MYVCNRYRHETISSLEVHANEDVDITYIIAKPILLSDRAKTKQMLIKI